MRRRKAGLLAILAGVVALVLAAFSPVPAATDREGEDYDLLVEKNIFLRDRRRRVVRRPMTTRPVVRRVVYDTDRSFVLTGIARRDGEYVAFFENVRTEATTRIATSQPVGKGEVGAITLDGVEYRRDGSTATIKMGQSLAGTVPVRVIVPPVPVAPASPSGPTTQPAMAEGDTAGGDTAGGDTAGATAGTGAPSATGKPITGGSAASIAEQMRRRRQQELEK